MADLTIGEVGKVLRLNLYQIDATQNPPVKIPLDLTLVDEVLLDWAISPPGQQPANSTNEVTMSVVDPPTSGIVEYGFISGDLVKPANMGRDGLFWYSVSVLFDNGTNLISNFDGKLTIKREFIE